MKKIIAVASVLMMALALVGCKQKEQASDGKAVGEKKFVVGFANIAESNQTTKEIGDCIVEECSKLGMEVIRVNNNFDGATAVKNVDDLLTMGINALIEFNVDQSVAPVIMEKCNAAKIPVFAIDIIHPGATFFGADNQYAGEIAGEYMGQLAKDLWGGQVDCLLLVDQMASGELPRKRILGSIPGIKKVLPDFDEKKIFFVEGKQDAGTAQQVTSDFLSAHPDWHHILIGALQDDGFRGACAAVEVAGRQNDVLAVGQNEYFFMEYARAHPQEDFVRGAVAFFLTGYGKWLAPAVRDKLDGKPVPENVYVDHVVLTRANMNQYYPQ
jgi:ribose transport system substrate-binding protein